MATGALGAASATGRLPFMAGVIAALVLLPLVGRAYPTTAGWALAAGIHLAATLLGALLAWVATRPAGPSLPESRTLDPRGWVIVVALAVAFGVAAWPLAIEWLDPLRTAEARATGWLEPARWSLGASSALIVVALGRLLVATDPARLAAGAAFAMAASWSMAVAVGAGLPELSLAAVSLVLPVAAATAAWRALQPA